MKVYHIENINLAMALFYFIVSIFLINFIYYLNEFIINYFYQSKIWNDEVKDMLKNVFKEIGYIFQISIVVELTKIPM
jgi:hypothetical protein